MKVRQPSLFDAPRRERPAWTGLARADGPQTSKDAAIAARAGMPKSRADILAALRPFGDRGATTVELAAVLHKDRATFSGRMAEMERDGLVRRTGEKRRTSEHATGECWAVVEETHG